MTPGIDAAVVATVALKPEDGPPFPPVDTM